MRPPTKGRVLKERVWCFVEALLTRAEDSSDFEVHWEDEDTDRPKFVVKTRRRFLEVLTQLKQSHIYEVINSLKGLELLEDRRFKQKRGSDQWCFALKLWSTDAQRNREQFERVWEGSRTAKSKALEATDKKSGVSAEAPQDEIDWRDVCRSRLEKQKQLTTNRLMSAKQMVFDINQIHVPLALVERKQTDKRSGDDNPERSQLYKPDYEETQKLEYKEFLATVLKASPSNKIAIIGEPGAGKTTLLQRIAFWILDNTDGLPIWIPLGNLPTPAPQLKKYLLNNWLEDAISNVTPKIRAEFEGLLTAGRVWLLLDGVDEMVANSGNPLSFIDNWIPGWCQHLSVVLTCRLNVWEANPHALYKFQTYRTLEFSQEKVNKFIEDCFQNRRGAQLCAPTLGEQLQQALNQPGKERIKDLIRNPLRLTLLCSTWHLREGKLPDTKAELYQQFVEEVYRWKEDEFPTTAEERKQLNAKLKELALAAIDKEENRFCLRHKFVESVLGERDSSVFQLALNIGWLNRVGVDAKNPNPNQPVYAFFHPTFQEYFAALAIDDWDFFLPRAHDNQNPKPVSERYRIFEPQWKEVFLLWLGRPEEEVPYKQKEEFIQALVQFQDGCRDFYWYQGYFLAAAGIAEFRDCNHNLANEIVEQLVKWSFGYFNSNRECLTDIAPIQVGARAVVSETEPIKAIDALVELIQQSHNISIIEEAINSLGEIGKGNLKAIKVLESLIQKEPQPPEFIQLLTARNLGKIDKDNPKVITELMKLTQNYQNEYLPKAAINILGEIGKSNKKYITALEQLIPDYQPEFIRLQAALNLGKIDEDKSKAIDTLVELINSYHERTTLIVAINILGEIGRCNRKSINAMELLIQKKQPQSIRIKAALNLGKIDKEKSNAVDTLVEIIQNPEYGFTPYEAIKNLAQVGKGIQKAVDTLVKLTDKSHDLETRWSAVRSLGEIDKQEAVDALVELIDDCQNPSIKREAAQFLGEIDRGNSKAIEVLVHLIEMYQHESIGWMAAESLAKIDRGNPKAIAALIKLIRNPNPHDFSTPMQALDSLKDSLKRTLREDQQRKKVVIDLKDYLSQENRENHIGRYCDCYSVIWHCAQNMTYPAFYQAWHPQEGVEKTTTADSQSLNQADLPQILQSAIANDPQLSQIIHLICIDGSQFIEPDRPAAEIYDQMLDQNCPECNEVPETMLALKLYWNSLKRNSDKRPVLVFYASSTEPYSEAFLTDLSKFKGAICVVTSPPTPLLQGEGSKMPSEESKSGSGSPSSLQGEGVRGWGSLQFFAPSQAIADVVQWIQAMILEE